MRYTTDLSSSDRVGVFEAVVAWPLFPFPEQPSLADPRMARLACGVSEDRLADQLQGST